MKSLGSIACVLGVLLVFFVPAAEAVPKIGPLEAKFQSQRHMRTEPVWRYRDQGWIDCSRGRLSRSEWVCRVFAKQGSRCIRGRLRVVARYSYEYEEVRYWTYAYGRRYRC